MSAGGWPLWGAEACPPPPEPPATGRSLGVRIDLRLQQPGHRGGQEAGCRMRGGWRNYRAPRGEAVAQGRRRLTAADVERLRGDDPELTSDLRIEGRGLKAGGLS